MYFASALNHTWNEIHTFLRCFDLLCLCCKSSAIKHTQVMATLQSPAAKLATLRSQLEDLNEALKPVLQKESLASLTTALESFNEPGSSKLTGRLQSAQLQSSLAYVLLDLVWILLKINGTDPHAHPVTEELKRVQEYLIKVHKADKEPVDSQRDAPPVDAEKASRFIKGALGKRTIFAEDGTIEKIVDVPDGLDQIGKGEPKKDDKRSVEQVAEDGDEPHGLSHQVKKRKKHSSRKSG